MNHKAFFIVSIFTLSLLSCVPAKQFNDLETKFKSLEKDNEELAYDFQKTKDQLAENERQLNKFLTEKEDLQYQIKGLEQERDLLQKNYDNLKSSYDALETSSSSALQENTEKNKKLLRQIEEKQEELANERQRLEQLQNKLNHTQQDLEKRSQRVDDLEDIIASQKKQMNALKDKVSAALTNFEGKGLEVYQKDGKVYVSMENKLLFSSGSYIVNEKGQEAVIELGKVLAENSDINVLIEGHTDSDAYKGGGAIENNWDLSTRRSTAVVQILLKNNAINPKRITAAGRSQYAPVADNSTTEGKAKNRRIEVILTPQLEQLSALLNDQD